MQWFHFLCQAMPEFGHSVCATEKNKMKTLDLDLKSLVIGVLLTMVIVLFMLIATTGGTHAWEYQTITTVSVGIPQEISKLGEEGWEVVGYTHWKPPTGQGNDYSYFVLKRAKRSHLNWKFWK